jgi:hypothetical protein
MTTLNLSRAEIAWNVNGRYLDDPSFTPFWEAIQTLDALVLVHPNQVVGPERSAYPYDVGDPEPVESLRATGIGNEQMQQIAAGNACKFLGIAI